MATQELSERERYISLYREGEGQAYAWGKTARLLTEPYLMTTLQETTGDFLLVDLCCSYPIYRQIMMGQHKTRTRTEMRRVSGAFIDDLQGAHKRDQFSSVQGLDASTLKDLETNLRQEILSHGNLWRARYLALCVWNPLGNLTRKLFVIGSLMVLDFPQKAMK